MGWLVRRTGAVQPRRRRDDYRVDPTLRNEPGLLVIWRSCADVELELVGLRPEYYHARLATGLDADRIATRFERACSELGEQRFTIENVSQWPKGHA
jgi:hypothetical protein